jgi:hypothetical protein
MSRLSRIMFTVAAAVAVVVVAGTAAQAVASSQNGKQTDVQLFVGEGSP